MNETFHTTKAKRYIAGTAKFNMPHREEDLECEEITFERLRNEQSDGLLQMVRLHPNLLKLVFVDSKLENINLNQLLSYVPKLKHFTFNWGNIYTAGAIAIANNLKSLMHLSIQHSGIQLAGAQAIASNLPRLRYLDITSNKIGLEGAAAISRKLNLLTTLAASENAMGTEGIILIACNLTDLYSLKIFNNECSPLGLLAIARNLINLEFLNAESNTVKMEERLRRNWHKPKWRA